MGSSRYPFERFFGINFFRTQIWENSEVPTILSINAWKMIFSVSSSFVSLRFKHDTEDFAAISLPQSGATPNDVNVWRLNAFENCQRLKNEEQDVILDACWQNTSKKGMKFLFVLTKRKRLYRHPIVHELLVSAW